MSAPDWGGLAVKLAGALVDAALVTADRKDATAAVILAELRPSPEDITVPYHDARRILLGDEDELPSTKKG